jgi:hypothetical protein
MIDVSNKFKRQVDDWIAKGVCARHKYINAFFKFLWRILKSSFKYFLLVVFFVLGLIFYKAIWNKEHK